MKTLDEIKDEVAKESTQIDWRYAMKNNGSEGISSLWEQVCQDFADQEVKAFKEKVIENLKQLVHPHREPDFNYGVDRAIEKINQTEL